MVLAAGLGTRMRPLTDNLPQGPRAGGGRALLDRVLDKLVEAGVRRAVVNVHHFADQVEDHLRARTDLDIAISDERAGLLDSGGGIQHARALLGEDPVFVANIDSLWLEGATPALEGLKRAWRPELMDLLLLVVRRGHGIGFEGPQGFLMDEAGRLTHSASPDVVTPFANVGFGILKPQVLDGPARRRFLDHSGLASASGRGPALRCADGRLLDARGRPRRTRRGRGEAGGDPPSSSGRDRAGSTFPAHRPFAQDLARGLHEALSPLGPEALSQATVLTPTPPRRPRALADAFVGAADGRAVLPPQMRPLGDLEEGEPPFEPGDLALDLPAAIEPLRRRFELTRMVSEYAHLLPGRELTASSALEMADALGGFLDSLQIEEVEGRAKSWRGLVEADLAEHWRVSRDFLETALVEWPKRLAALGVVDVSERRVRLLRRLADAWTDHPPQGVLVGGRVDRDGAGHCRPAQGHRRSAAGLRRAAGAGRNPRRQRLGRGRGAAPARGHEAAADKVRRQTRRRRDLAGLGRIPGPGVAGGGG